MVSLALLSILVAVMWTTFYLRKYIKTVYLGWRIPGPPPLPFLGNALLIGNNETLNILGSKMSKFYGPISRYWISVIPFFLFSDPFDIQVILGSTKSTSTKNMFYSFLHNFIGEGLITSTGIPHEKKYLIEMETRLYARKSGTQFRGTVVLNGAIPFQKFSHFLYRVETWGISVGDRWKLHRKLIQPYFQISVLKIHFGAFSKCSKDLVEALKLESNNLNIVSFANKFALDVLHIAILGVQNDFQNSPFRKGKALVPYRVMRPWLFLDAFFKLTDESRSESEQQQSLRTHIKTILEKKRRNMNQNKIVRPNNLMEMLMEISDTHPEFKEDDVIDETCTFMLAGQDSVSAALAFSLYFLAAHRDVQDKVLEEQNDIFKNTDRPEEFEDVAEMKYLEQCIKETLRLCPSVPVISRKLIKDVHLGKRVH